jgi:hypothetical protein
MSFKLEVDPQEKIVEVEVEGALDNALRMKILSAIAYESEAGNCSGALIDLRRSIFDLSEPIEGAVKLTMYMSDLGISPKTRLALVYKEAEVHRSTFEKITQKIGYQLRYFKNTDDAYRWLKSSSTQSQ